MRVIIGNQYVSVVDGSTVSITRSVSDPVPTCTLNLKDVNSSINVQMMQEIVILDDQVTPNPTHNLLLNPAMNPYNTSWTSTAHSGLAYTTAGGGGLKVTLTNAAVATDVVLSQTTLAGWLASGQSYMFSCSVQGSSTPTNVEAGIQIVWLDAGQNTISTLSFTSAGTVSTSSVQYTVSGVAPSTASFAQVNLTIVPTNATNSGVVTFTQAQLEPEWFPTLTYPTPWCGPSQTNCQQLPLGFYIRQYRKFAGFVNHKIHENYHGNVRDIQVDAVGYAWLAGLTLVTDTYSTQTDAFIIGSLTSKYFSSSGTNMVTTTNVITGITISALAPALSDMRTVFDGLAGLSGFYWTIDYYWNFIYAPPGYFSQMITLIGDSSSDPDFVTSYPVYEFQAETDFTQPGCTIHSLGSSSNEDKIVDVGQITQIGFTSGYFLPPLNSAYARKVQDSSLSNDTDLVQRGMAELLQFDYPRALYHLKTQVELIPGYGVSVTSSTDGLSQSVLLVQQVQSKWLGTSELLTDQWEYQADLGATNKAATHILSRIFRIATGLSSAPSLNSITLASIENLHVLDTIDSNSLYAETVLSDTPLWYARLGEPAGFGITTTYDWSGNTNNGTINGTVTLGQPGALDNDLNTAYLFDGSTGDVTLSVPITNGLAALSMEAWVNFTSASASNARLLANDHPSSTNTGVDWSLSTSGSGGPQLVLGNGTTSMTLSRAFAFQTGVWYYVAVTWSASGNAILYVNVGGTVTSLGTGTLTGTIGTAAHNLALGFLPGFNSNFFPGYIDEPAIYPTQLSLARLQTHYNVGALGHT